MTSTPAQRLNINRQQIQMAMRAEPFPELAVARDAATRAVRHYPLATAAVVVVAVVLVVNIRPWRWLRPSGAMQLALAQWAWHAAQKTWSTALSRPALASAAQASASKKA